ncbi:hypothetical protein YPPY08_4888, partial [Yersinia pestis PY-08]
MRMKKPADWRGFV